MTSIQKSSSTKGAQKHKLFGEIPPSKLPSKLDDALEQIEQLLNKRYSFETFCSQVRSIMEKPALEKGYSTVGVDGPNPTDLFMEEHFEGHTLGEATYKLIRFRKKHNIEDLEKAAAWIFLEWRRALRASK